MGISHIAPVIWVKTMRGGYKKIIDRVIKDGRYSEPRGKPTRELQGATIVLKDPTDSLPIGTGRKVVPKIAAIEACQLIAGQGAHSLVLNAAPRFRDFAEPNGKFHGNYGDRVSQQLGEVYRKLTSDPDNRQAIITIWEPILDNVAGKRDYPCTLSMQFLLRDDQLNMITTMRSNDVWLGIAYDFFQFTQLQLTLCKMLRVEPGLYVHHAGSLHLYESNLEAAQEVKANETMKPWLPDGIGLKGSSYGEVRARAIQLLANDPATRSETQSEAWYRRHIGPLHDG